jgi:hypothetical protein
MAELGVLLHGSICAFDCDDFLNYRKRVCKEYLALGGVWVWRVITFHFDDTYEEGLTLWDQQDWLVSGEFGAIENSKPLVLETPARMMKGCLKWKTKLGFESNRNRESG